MKVVELMNELSRFKGNEECFLLDGGTLAIAGKAVIDLPAAGVDLQPSVEEGGVQFASKAAGAAATAAGLGPADFESFDASSPKGFTLSDVGEIVAALEATDGG